MGCGDSNGNVDGRQRMGKDKTEIAAGIRMEGADGEKRGEERKGDGGNINGNKEGFVGRRI